MMVKCKALLVSMRRYLFPPGVVKFVRNPGRPVSFGACAMQGIAVIEPDTFPFLFLSADEMSRFVFNIAEDEAYSSASRGRKPGDVGFCQAWKGSDAE